LATKARGRPRVFVWTDFSRSESLYRSVRHSEARLQKPPSWIWTLSFRLKHLHWRAARRDGPSKITHCYGGVVFRLATPFRRAPCADFPVLLIGLKALPKIFQGRTR
jgi:hypothetical protein